MGQALLFGREPVRADASFRSVKRIELGHGAWLEHQPGWLSGHSVVFEALRDRLVWRAQRRQMYDREIDVPRLLAHWPSTESAKQEGHPVIRHCVEMLSERYQRDLSAVSLAYYRDGSDSVAPHGDRMGPLTIDCVIAIVAVGDRRRFLMRPALGSGPALAFELGWGDLLVMGGSCQETFVHGIPKTSRPVGP
ncbi:MAG: alpha-ketoglutarate-dependent dioxygenase AlkB, partial [Myxococcota bacterium]